jgi:DNA modification methylase
MPVEVIRADARALPIADNSVDLIVSSPPYWSLRAYQDNGQAYAGQIGSEDTSQEFITNLLDVMRECIRVLKPTGSCFINLGDKYGPDKSLLMLPERFRIACRDQLGLIYRAGIVWSKPNGLPESVTDRVRRSHEDWMHFTLQPRYFSAVDEIREPLLHPDWSRPGRSDGPANQVRNLGQTSALRNADYTANPLGKLPGSVWTVPTEPLRVPEHLGVDHFAAFPSEFPRRIIAGWSPSGVCVECGEGRRPVVTKGDPYCSHANRKTPVGEYGAGMHGKGATTLGYTRDTTISAYACACTEDTWITDSDTSPDAVAATSPSVAAGGGEAGDAPRPAPQRNMPPTRKSVVPDTTPAVVLDPFGGTGTTAHVAHALGRHGISVDLSADYCRLASAPELADVRMRKVLGIDKAKPEIEGQVDLFGDDAA